MINKFIDEDKYFLISSDEFNRLMVILDEDGATEALFYLQTIISTKTMTIKDPYGGLIYFD